MTPKSIGYFRLVEACDTAGCPICRCLVEDGRRQLDALLYEQVNDIATRRRLRASWGLCNWHTWTLATIGGGLTGSAIVYEDLLGHVIRRVEAVRDRRRPALWHVLSRLSPFARHREVGSRPSLVDRYRTRPSCPVCVHARESEIRYVETVVDNFDSEELALAYKRSSGLCVPHVLQAIERRSGTAGLRQLLGRTLPKWATLRRDLEAFVRKHEYRNTEPISQVESAAGTTVFEMLTGAPGVGGNDLHCEHHRGVRSESETVPRRSALPDSRGCAESGRAT